MESHSVLVHQKTLQWIDVLKSIIVKVKTLGNNFHALLCVQTLDGKMRLDREDLYMFVVIGCLIALLYYLTFISGALDVLIMR